MSIGERLEIFRKSNFSTKKKLAEALDISYEHLYQYLSDKKKPGSEILSKLSELGCNIDWLLTGQSNKTTGAPMGTNQVNEPKENYSFEISELRKEIQKLHEEVAEVRSRNREILEENKNLWEALANLGYTNQVLTLINNKINPSQRPGVKPP